MAPLGEPDDDRETDVTDDIVDETDATDDDHETDAARGAPAFDVRRVAGLCVYSDVTETRRAERELAAAPDRLEEVGRLVEDEGRPALNVARGYLELAEETGADEHFREVEDGHDGLREALDHLAGLEADAARLRECFEHLLRTATGQGGSGADGESGTAFAFRGVDVEEVE